MVDEQAKRERGYTDKRSKVRPDGSEILYGKDWMKRKVELWDRCQSQCEHTGFDMFMTFRCRSIATDPHHIKPRSKGRDDRLSNLKALCRMHHELLDWKKTKWSKKDAA